MGKANLLLLSLALILAMSLVSCSGSVPLATPEVDPSAACPQLEPHPIGESISEKFDIPYEDVMGWFCDGETFEDILLALETKELTGHNLEELFALRKQMSWEEMWKQMGVVP